jgi:hypothetical protein
MKKEWPGGDKRIILIELGENKAMKQATGQDRTRLCARFSYMFTT